MVMSNTRYAYDDRGFRIESICYDEQDRVHFRQEMVARRCAQNTTTRVSGLSGPASDWMVSPQSKQSVDVLRQGARLTRRAKSHDAISLIRRIVSRRVPYGYARVKYFYDEMGRENKREFFDTNGTPVPTHVGIDKVESGSKSECSGLRVGDLIVAYDGQEVADVRLFHELELIRGERARQVIIQRAGKVLTIDVAAGRLTGLETVERSAVGSKIPPRSPGL